MKGHTCSAVCDFKGTDSDSCKTNIDCRNCTGDEYITNFPVGWRPSITRNIEKVYTYNECKEKCKKATKETALNFLQLDQSGQYLENKCRKIGDNKVVCKPISKEIQGGLVAGYDGCSVCNKNTGMFGYFEYEKKWNKTIKQWDFINIKEINNPPRTWFDDGSGAGAGAGAGGGGLGGGSGYGARDGGMGMGSWRSGAGDYKRDGGAGGARGARGAGEIGKLQSGNEFKSFSIGSASQNAKMQQQQSNLEDMKLKINQLNNDYKSLSDNVNWNKMQMDKAEKDCSDMTMKLKKAISDYSKAEAASIKVGATVKEKKDTEAANTYMYSVKQKTREICDNYGLLKDKYMKSVNEMNALKNNINDLTKKYDSYAASIGGAGGGGGGVGSMLSPIINIFFGDDANRDCSGQLGCGQGINYSFPSPFNSSKGGMFVPQPYQDMIRF
jgi:outer membrane murein-binding lipoprotein Lpp